MADTIQTSKPGNAPKALRGKTRYTIEMTPAEQARARVLLIATGPPLAVGLVIRQFMPALAHPYQITVVLAALVIFMLFLIGLLGFLASHWSSPVYQRKYTPRFLALLFSSLGCCAFFAYSMALWRSSPGWAIVVGASAALTGAATTAIYRKAQTSGSSRSS